MCSSDLLTSATSRMAGAVMETVADAAASVGGTASKAYDAATGALTDSGPAIKRVVRDQSSAATGLAGGLQGNLKDTFQRQPLLLGAIGIAIGAGMAAAVPRTQFETEYAGETAERVTEQVKEFASQQVDRVTSAAERTVAAVKDEVVAQGLTSQGAKETAAAIGEKIKTAAKSARGPRPS